MRPSAKELDQIDLGSLSTFLTVYRLRSFSRAADRLNQNQSRVSYAVAKLRRAFRDPLFVKHAGGITPTDKCHHLASLARQVLDGAESLVQSEPFEPVAWDAEVTLSCNQYQRELILPPLIELLRARAPRVRLRVITATNRGEAQLQDGDTDLLICPTLARGQGLYRRKLLDERYMCVVCAESSWAGRDPTLEEFAAARHAIVNYGDGWQSGYMRELDERGIVLDQAFVVPSPVDLDAILPGTELVSTIPGRQAKRMGAELAWVDCPVPAPFQINLYWTARIHHSPPFRWLRERIAGIARSIDD